MKIQSHQAEPRWVPALELLLLGLIFGVLSTTIGIAVLGLIRG
jgi:hypothetical protein